ncbi:tRNA-specific 2-thiouridylase MnmA [Eubacteriaceae bacterium CHKCI005]|nr:tRNA-specific 2-thiouridylase MnmA [Eubacteriaceae bacterium CHKCI005]
MGLEGGDVMAEKVMVGMSGGVDSSVAAALLLQQGYDVAGMTLKLKPEYGCMAGWSHEAEDARRVADKLGIPHYVVDLTKPFAQNVIDYFVEEYLHGRTPNPCVACNRTIKFGAMLEKARELGYNRIATGHYASIEKKDGRYLLKRSPAGKDQSYVLYHLTQNQLAHTVLPLCTYEKEEIRRLAERYRLPVAHKPDSQEICFIPDDDYASFIRDYAGKTTPPGDFVDEKGNVLGQHKGILHYTVGQRKGLGIAFGRPMYVRTIDPEKNQVVLVEGGKEYFTGLMADGVNFIPFDWPQEEMKVEVMVRYQSRLTPARLVPLDDNKVQVLFDAPIRAVTPGQAAVFYRGDLVLGGGRIVKSIPLEEE